MKEEEFAELDKMLYTTLSLADEVIINTNQVDLLDSKLDTMQDFREILIDRYNEDKKYHLTRQEVMYLMETCNDVMGICLHLLYDMQETLEK